MTFHFFICSSGSINKRSRTKTYLVLIFLLCIFSCFYYLFLLQNSTTSNRVIVHLLGIQPAGPKTLIYDDSSGLLMDSTSSSKINNGTRSSRRSKKRKLMLFWTPKYGSYSLAGWGIHSKTLSDCPLTSSSSCDFSIDQDLVKEADAIVFHPAIDMSLRNNLPTPRSPAQLYIMSWSESPHYTLLNLQNYPSYFNWTMTYRRDSQIYAPYGGFISRSTKLTSIPQDYINKIRPKTKLVAWLVSSCSSVSHREDLVTKLSEYVQVDVFGDCGPLSCPTNTSINCMEWLSSQYKFYLAFENSLCRDYVTEKFFNPLQLGMIPIYYGGVGVDEIAPPNSFINVNPVPYPGRIKALAELLKYLDRNPEEYLKYFEWTKSFSVGNKENEYCRLCKKLHDESSNINTKNSYSYVDLNKWWNEVDEQGRPICLETPSLFDKWKAFIDYVL